MTNSNDGLISFWILNNFYRCKSIRARGKTYPVCHNTLINESTINPGLDQKWLKFYDNVRPINGNGKVQYMQPDVINLILFIADIFPFLEGNLWRRKFAKI